MESWEDIAREQADTLLKQQGLLEEGKRLIQILSKQLEAVRAYCLAADKKYSPNWFWSEDIKKILGVNK